MMVVSNLKKQLSITALTCSALLALTSPVNADTIKVGNVYYCEGEHGAFVEGPDYAFSRWKPFKFKFSVVDTKTIRFGSGSYFDGKTFTITNWNNYDIPLDTVRPRRNFAFNGERFHYGSASGFGSSFMTGTCDKF